MKNCTIFFPTLLLLLLHLQLCFCNQNLINQTCKKTPFPDLCVSSLQADPRSKSANLQGLARIMVDVIDAKATATHQRIKKMLNGNPPDSKLKRALSSCADKYYAIIAGDVAQAGYAVDTGNYKFAVDATNDAAGEADDCERGFGGRSPMSAMNKNMHGISVVAWSMVNMLI